MVFVACHKTNGKSSCEGSENGYSGHYKYFFENAALHPWIVSFWPKTTSKKFSPIR